MPPTAPLNVVHLISAMPVGGVETNLVRVLPRLPKARYKVSLVVTRERGYLADELEAKGVPVHLVHQRTRWDPPSLWRLSRHLRAANCHLLHTHMRRANTSGRVAAMLARTPIRVATEHDMRLDKNWRHDRIDRWLANHTDVILGVTRAVCDINRETAGIPAERFRVMYLGLELDYLAKQPPVATARAALGIPWDGPVIGFVGRLHPIKNVPAIIRALREPGMEAARLAIVGDDSERAPCEALVDELGLRERVVFTGFRDDLPAVFAAIDVMIMASDSEGIATVQMESMAAGVPVVTTPVGLCAEALRAGVEYVEIPAPTPAAIAAGLREALEPTRAEALRTAGRAAIQRFSIEAQVDFLDRLYQELAAKHGLVPSDPDTPRQPGEPNGGDAPRGTTERR